MNTWPDVEGFPQYALLGSEGGPDENAKISTQVARGRQRSRTVTENPSEFYPVAVLVESQAHLELFEEFFYDTLEGGDLEFEWTHPDNSSQVINCKIDGMYKKSCQVPNKVYRISFLLEILP